MSGISRLAAMMEPRTHLHQLGDDMYWGIAKRKIIRDICTIISGGGGLTFVELVVEMFIYSLF